MTNENGFLRGSRGRTVSGNFSDALNDCLERLKRGESVYDCLRRHPELADELEPLLKVASATMRAAESAAPSADAKARGFAAFSAALDERERAAKAKASAPASGRGFMRWLRSLGLGGFGLPAPLARPLAVAVLCAAVFATGIGATTAAASGSVPGEPLYWVKTARENVERHIPRSDAARAGYQARLAQARADEAQALMSRGSFTAADATIKRMNGHLDRSARYAGITIVITPVEMPRPASKIGAGNARALIDRLERDRDLFRAKSAAMMPKLSPEDRIRARRAMRETELGYWLLINAIQESQRAAQGERRHRRGGE